VIHFSSFYGDDKLLFIEYKMDKISDKVPMSPTFYSSGCVSFWL